MAFYRLFFSSQILLYLLTIINAQVSNDSEIKYEITYYPENCKQKLNEGDTIRIHYDLFIDESSTSGTKGLEIESTKAQKHPHEFLHATNRAKFPWLDKGVKDMCVKEKRTIIVPPELAYGSKGNKKMKIPPNATLRYEVECLAIRDKIFTQPLLDIFSDIDVNRDDKLDKNEVKTYYESKRKMTKVPKDFWSTQDHDGDGFVSFDEFTGPKIRKKHDEL